MKNVPHVYKLDAENKIVDTDVKIGMETPEKAEVLSGVEEGEVVVTGGRSQVKPGQVVKPKMGGR